MFPPLVFLPFTRSPFGIHNDCISPSLSPFQITEWAPFVFFRKSSLSLAELLSLVRFPCCSVFFHLCFPQSLETSTANSTQRPNSKNQMEPCGFERALFLCCAANITLACLLILCVKKKDCACSKQCSGGNTMVVECPAYGEIYTCLCSFALCGAEQKADSV